MLRRVLKRRPDFCSKADFGHALLFTGCYGMMGSSSARRPRSFALGGGKLTVHAPPLRFQRAPDCCPRSALSPDRNENVISDMTPRVNFTAIGVGPGIGTNDATRGALETSYQDHKTADGVRCRCPQHHLPHACAHGPHSSRLDSYAPCR